MKRALLIGPKNTGIRSGQFPAPPLGLHRISSYLEKRSIALVDVVDPNLDEQELYRKLESTKYHVIGHSILHPTIKNDLKIIFDAEESQPHALKIAGGQGASFNHAELIGKTPIKVVVRGFGEEKLESILSGERLSEIPGLYIEDHGKSYTTKSFDETTDEKFREISLGIMLEKIPYERYWEKAGAHYGSSHLTSMKSEGMLKTVRLMTSNYCPMGCTFCSSTNFLNDGTYSRQKILQLSVGDISSLMTDAIKTHPQTEAFYFNDDNFMLDKERTEEFCYNAEVFRLNLMCMGRVDNVDPVILANMKRAGFKIIFYGVETFSDALAMSINKTRKEGYGDRAREAVINSLDAGLVAQMSLMLFIPGSTIGDLETTIDSAVELLARGARVTVFPYMEAYSGAKIATGYRVSHDEFEIKGQTFRLPGYALPENDILDLAENSIRLKGEINLEESSRYGKIIPQPIDSLNLFKALYMLTGRCTKNIEMVKCDIISDRC